MAPPPYRDVPVGELLTALARALPDHPALVYPRGPRYSFAQLDQEARRLARGLLRQGVSRRERVVVWATNIPEWIVLQFALAKIGAILVTANTALRPREIDYLVRQSEAATLVTIRGVRGSEYVDALREIGATRGQIPTLRRIVYIGSEPPEGFLPYQALRADADGISEGALDDAARQVDVDDVINMQYTSGTTGFPKGVMLSSRNIVNNAHALAQGLGYTEQDRLCLCVPLFHCFGCVIGVLGAYTHGACLCPIETFDPLAVLETVERERCTAIYGVPTMFIAELEHPRFAEFDLTSLRTGVMAGALCPEPLMRRVMTEMHVPEITIAYGLTEASPGITMTPRDCPVGRRSQTVGVVLPELEVKIVDPATGHETPPGGRGELLVRGYNVMKGYFNNPEATRAAIDADAWLHSGDEASIERDGFVTITGRIKDLIIRGGENIAPGEIEDCLRAHPAVADANVYGLPDAYFGEIVAAAVRLKKGDGAAAVSADELTRWCTERLARFKVPKLVRFVSEFPMTASGKVQKFKLREDHQKSLAS